MQQPLLVVLGHGNTDLGFGAGVNLLERDGQGNLEVLAMHGPLRAVLLFGALGLRERRQQVGKVDVGKAGGGFM